MCGIAGVINVDGSPVSPVLLRRMTDAIAHRGPDGEGQWIEGNVGIGHRRLAIIDLSPAGHQPMVDSRNRFILSYNGEVYNYRELRIELERLGYRFRSNTDSEVVLNAFAEWGTDALSRFNGMFSLAIWDRETKTLTLARDRYGIKPVYYCFQGNHFAFGSEQKAIVAQPYFKRDLNKKALLEYFTFQNILTDQTLLQGVKILPAGQFLQVKIGGTSTPQISTTRYWDYWFREPDGNVDKRECEEELQRLFSQAVKRQLVGDVEIGAYLSGGMDSGSITSIAAREIPTLKNFTVGFDLSSASGIELAFDERAKAEAMSAAFRTEHYEMVLKAGDMERCLPDLVWSLEEPRVGQSYPNFYAAKLASRFVKVVLSGAGGDELFGGYPWRYYRGATSRNFEEFIDSYYLYWQRLASNTELRDLFAPIWSEVDDVWTRDIFRDVFENHSNELSKPEDYINHSLYFEAKTFLHGLLVVEDKVSMAHGLETRLPFLDNDLVDFAMTVPVGLKVSNLEAAVRVNENDALEKGSRRFQKSSDGKQILRDVMVSHVPPAIATAEKQGFSSPDSSWFRGESLEYVRTALDAKTSSIGEVLSGPAIKKMLEQHLNGFQNRRLLVWSMINVETWLKKWL